MLPEEETSITLIGFMFLYRKVPSQTVHKDSIGITSGLEQMTGVLSSCVRGSPEVSHTDKVKQISHRRAAHSEYLHASAIPGATFLNSLSSYGIHYSCHCSR